MTDPCVICQHAKIDAINAACLSGRYFAVIAHQFRLDKDAMRVHAEAQHFRGLDLPVIPSAQATPSQVHKATRVDQPADVLGQTRVDTRQTWPAQALTKKPLSGVLIPVRESPEGMREDPDVSETPLAALKPALPHVRRAFQLAGVDEDAQMDVLAALNATVRAALQREDMGLP